MTDVIVYKILILAKSRTDAKAKIICWQQNGTLQVAEQYEADLNKNDVFKELKREYCCVKKNLFSSNFIITPKKKKTKKDL